MDHAEQPVDPAFIGLACILATCQPDHLLRATWSEGALTVQVINYPAYVFTAPEIAHIAQGSIAVAVACGLHQRPAPGWYEQHIKGKDEGRRMKDEEVQEPEVDWETQIAGEIKQAEESQARKDFEAREQQAEPKGKRKAKRT